MSAAMSTRLTQPQRHTPSPKPEWKFEVGENENCAAQGARRANVPVCVRQKKPQSLFEEQAQLRALRKKLARKLDRSPIFSLDCRTERVSLVTSSFKTVCELEQLLGGKKCTVLTDGDKESYRWDIYSAQAQAALSSLTFRRRRQDVLTFCAHVEARRFNANYRTPGFASYVTELATKVSQPPSRRPASACAPRSKSAERTRPSSAQTTTPSLQPSPLSPTFSPASASPLYLLSPLSPLSASPPILRAVSPTVGDSATCPASPERPRSAGSAIASRPRPKSASSAGGARPRPRPTSASAAVARGDSMRDLSPWPQQHTAAAAAAIATSGAAPQRRPGHIQTTFDHAATSSSSSSPPPSRAATTTPGTAKTPASCPAAVTPCGQLLIPRANAHIYSPVKGRRSPVASSSASPSAVADTAITSVAAAGLSPPAERQFRAQPLQPIASKPHRDLRYDFCTSPFSNATQLT